MTDRRRGLLLGIVGVAVIIPDATLIRLVDAPSVTTAMWRAGLAAGALAVFLLGRYGKQLPTALGALGRWGAVSSLIVGSGTILFVVAVDTTAVANVVLILALSPMWAALMTRLTTGVRPPRRTLVAMPFAFAGVIVAVAGSVESGLNTGDLLALIASVGLATNLTIVRAQHHVDMVPAAAVGSFFGFAALLVVGTSFQITSGDLAPLLLLGLVVIPGAIGLLTAAARYLSSPETALLLLGETALSPLLAAVVIDEPITGAAFAGGAIVIATLTIHAWAGLRTPAATSRTPSSPSIPL